MYGYNQSNMYNQNQDLMRGGRNIRFTQANPQMRFTSPSGFHYGRSAMPMFQPQFQPDFNRNFDFSSDVPSNFSRNFTDFTAMPPVDNKPQHDKKPDLMSNSLVTPGNKRSQRLANKANNDEPQRKKHKSNNNNNQPSTSSCQPAHTMNDKITESMWVYYQNMRQSDLQYRQKVDLRDALYAIFKDVFPYCGLYMVGSSMSGFATKTSDMDLCLMISLSEIDGKRECVEILLAIQKALRKCRFIKMSQVIRARVPILKFTDLESRTECDLNINNSVGIRNTHLLRYYAAMDWRVRPLVLFVKRWARFQDINDASKKTISSYSLCLMVIHYLQYGCSPPVLDSVQKLYPDLFDYGEDIRNLKMNVRIEFKSKNSSSLGDLLLGFLEYYANFDFDQDVISARLGCKLPFHMVMSKTPLFDQKQWTCLKIEEPFDHSNTARSCYDPQTFMRVKHVFTKSYQKLRKTKDTESILTVPF